MPNKSGTKVQWVAYKSPWQSQVWGTHIPIPCIWSLSGRKGYSTSHCSVQCTIHPPVCHASVNSLTLLGKEDYQPTRHTTTYTWCIVIPGNWYILWSRTRFKNHNDKSSLYHTTSSSRDSLLKNSFQEEQSNEQPLLLWFIHSYRIQYLQARWLDLGYHSLQTPTWTKANQLSI